MRGRAVGRQSAGDGRVSCDVVDHVPAESRGQRGRTGGRRRPAGGVGARPGVGGDEHHRRVRGAASRRAGGKPPVPRRWTARSRVAATGPPRATSPSSPAVRTSPPSSASCRCLSAMGRRILHTGPLGLRDRSQGRHQLPGQRQPAVRSARRWSPPGPPAWTSTTTYEAIRISSGNSFVHETESQVILNGSRNINFTMDLVVKDMSLFQSVADRCRRAAGALAAHPGHLRSRRRSATAHASGPRT